MAISLYTVATSGRYGEPFDRQTNITTNGRYDKLIKLTPIVVEVTKPILRFVMKKPVLAYDMKKPNIRMVAI